MCVSACERVCVCVCVVRPCVCIRDLVRVWVKKMCVCVYTAEKQELLPLSGKYIFDFVKG